MKKVFVLTLMLMMLVGLVSATDVSVETSSDSGLVDIEVKDDIGTDKESTSRFRAIGGFSSKYNANDDNVDSLLNSKIEATSLGTTTRTRFDFESSHNLGTQNSNDNKMVLSVFTEAENVAMNFDLKNTNYQSEALRLNSLPMITAEDNTGVYWMGYTMTNKKRDDSYRNALIDVYMEGTGSAALGKTQYGSNHLARGIGYNQNALDVRDGEVSATGNGVYLQTASGDNSLEMNGFTFGSGWAQFEADFIDGLSGQYSIKAK